MQLYTVYLYLETAVHVSSGISTHHQERIQLYRHFFNNSKTNEDIATKQTHTTDTFLFITHTTNVLLFKSRCNFFIGFRIIKEMPCLVGSGTLCIFQYISTKIQLYTVYLYLETAVHVSGGTSTHHQERIQLYIQHLVFVTPLLLSAAIVEVFQLFHDSSR
jgi:hypothetical protein